MLAENLFLISLGLIWIIAAVVQDLRKREIANWWNFSLIAIALAYRAFVSLSLQDYRYFIYGLGGFAIFFILANAFYYARVFAGGDAKLLMGLGAVLPFSSGIADNLLAFFYFIFMLMLFGGIYGLLYSLALIARNRDGFAKEFRKQFRKNKKLAGFLVIPAVVSVILLFFILLVVKEIIFVILPALLIALPFLYFYGKAVEESCMIKIIGAGKLTEGDWLYEPVRLKGKTIKPNWEGLSVKEVKMLGKFRKKVKIKEGIPFTPAFLFAFVALLWVMEKGFFGLM